MSTQNVGSDRPLSERLVAEAVALVGEHGPQSLSLREVQRRAGVSPAAAYRHFRGREALMLAVAQQCAGLLADHIADALGSTPAAEGDVSAARSRLLAGCEAYVDFATQNPGLYRAIFAGDEGMEDLVAPSERARGGVGEGGYNLLVSALEDLVAATGGAPVHPWDPVSVWSCCHGLAMLRLDAALRFLPDADFARARDHVLRTITSAVPLDTTTPSPALAGDRTGPR